MAKPLPVISDTVIEALNREGVKFTAELVRETATLVHETNRVNKQWKKVIAPKFRTLYGSREAMTMDAGRIRNIILLGFSAQKQALYKEALPRKVRDEAYALTAKRLKRTKLLKDVASIAVKLIEYAFPSPSAILSEEGEEKLAGDKREREEMEHEQKEDAEASAGGSASKVARTGDSDDESMSYASAKTSVKGDEEDEGEREVDEGVVELASALDAIKVFMSTPTPQLKEEAVKGFTKITGTIEQMQAEMAKTVNAYSTNITLSKAQDELADIKAQADALMEELTEKDADGVQTIATSSGLYTGIVNFVERVSRVLDEGGNVVIIEPKVKGGAGVAVAIAGTA